MSRLVPFNSTISPKLFLEHSFTPNGLTPIRALNDLPSCIRYNRIHLTPYCFLPKVSIRRGICLFNGTWCVIHKIYNVIITKGLCSLWSLTLSSCYIVIFHRILYMVFISVFYRKKYSWDIVGSLSCVIFIGHSSSKNVASLDSIIVPTNMFVTPEFIIKNLYPML
jgi:hypothetical protein